MGLKLMYVSWGGYNYSFLWVYKATQRTGGPQHVYPEVPWWMFHIYVSLPEDNQETQNQRWVFLQSSEFKQQKIERVC